MLRRIFICRIQLKVVIYISKTDSLIHNAHTEATVRAETYATLFVT